MRGSPARFATDRLVLAFDAAAPWYAISPTPPSGVDIRFIVLNQGLAGPFGRRQVPVSREGSHVDRRGRIRAAVA